MLLAIKFIWTQNGQLLEEQRTLLKKKAAASSLHTAEYFNYHRSFRYLEHFIHMYFIIIAYLHAVTDGLLF